MKTNNLLAATSNKSARHEAGLTWVEVLVCLVVIGILFLLGGGGLGIGMHGGALTKAQMTQTLSNMKQLQLATQQLALDGKMAGEENLGWPGDTGGTFTSWTHQLVPGYLSSNDFCKLLSAPGIVVRADKFPSSMRQGAVLVYAVSSNSPPEAVFLTTANFTNGPNGGIPPHEKAKPYGDKGFVVFRKGGDGRILLKRQATNTDVIGSYVPLLQ